MADYFVSYTSSDRTEAHWIARELEKLEAVAHVYEWEIKGGDDIAAWMLDRHDAADHVLCVVSDAYGKAAYSIWERNAALWENATRPGFALFVIVKPCKLPTLAAHYRHCDIAGLPEEAAREKLRTFLASPVKGEAVWLPEITALSNIPVRVPEHFLGRDDALAAVDAALKRYAGRVAITAVHGLRGVGKTTLAAAYAERHKHDHRATWWIRAQSPEGMRADLVSLGVRLGWVAPDEKEAPAYEKVAERLRHEGEGLLLIYDNAIDADALRPFLPRGGAARVLVTSNAHAWRGLAEPIELKLWPKEIGADYFAARLGRVEAQAAALSEALGGLPLAHEQAAAYCERLGVSLADYLGRFAAQPIKLLDAGKDAPAEYHDRLTVAKTFALAIEEAGKLHPAAEPLIVHAALLAPAPIPLFLFSDGREALGEPLTSGLAEDGLEEALAALRAFALVDLESVADERDASVTTKCFRLHRLVRTVAAARREGEAREAAHSGLIGAMEAAMAAGEHPQDARSWPRLRRLAPLAEVLIRPSPVEGETDSRIAHVCAYLGTFLQFSLADHARARPLFERALAIYERARGPDHPDTASSLNILAYLLRAQGDLAAARPLYERALAICERALGPDHPDTATSLNNLASLLQAQGDFAAARPLFERALAIRERALGPDHPDTAPSLNKLAVLLQAQGDLAAARPLCERTLAICERALGPDHPDTAQSLNNLAGLLQAQGDLAAAQPLFERALAIRERALGPDHPDTAQSLNNLATILLAIADFASAIPLLQRALAIDEKALGQEHPDTAIDVSNLARAHVGLGDFAAAEPLFLRAIATGEAALGADHPLTQRFKSNYARLLAQTARAAEALPVAQGARAVHAKTNGPNHPWTKDSARAVAEALDGLGRADEAAAVRAEHGV